MSATASHAGSTAWDCGSLLRLGKIAMKGKMKNAIAAKLWPIAAQY
jgi:hypothetical protein